MKNAAIIKIIFSSLLAITSISCGKNKESKQNKAIAKVEIINNGEELYKQKCNICHSVTSKSHDEIIAPPMVAVKRRYLRSYNTKETFIKAISSWVANPNEEDAIMYGAVQQFKVMPKLPYTKENISSIAQYIYNNEIEKPTWFQQHFNEEHKNGKGRGNGLGKSQF